MAKLHGNECGEMGPDKIISKLDKLGNSPRRCAPVGMKVMRLDLSKSLPFPLGPDRADAR
ncbi:hypothetical protein [Sphingomonas bacterium]|uniref:hypothetical protein n=1 Tax=Sphingomonas bacterium TaxID=1895847 RepID=UPI001576FB05|nr:hypothetical protein [Sphingomonas bacterium]